MSDQLDQAAKTIDAVDFVRQAALEVYRPEGVEIWLRAPNPMLDGRTPLDALAAGQTASVLAVLEGMAAGVFV
jgi:uncharacterized protein (DUF2384 family)